MIKALELCDTQGFTSIAIPVISSNSMEFPKEDCAKIMMKAVVDFQKSQYLIKS